MAWGPVDYQCSHCTAMFADQRERNYHEDECVSAQEEERRKLERMAPSFIEHPCDEFTE